MFKEYTIENQYIRLSVLNLGVVSRNLFKRK